MFIKYLTRFIAKSCLFAAALAFAPLSALAQFTTSAAQSPNSSPAQDFTLWYIAFTILGAVFCASIFWWRREKGKEQTVATRGGGKNPPKNKIEKQTATQTVEFAEQIDTGTLRVPSWMKQPVNGDGDAKKTFEMPTFDALEAPAVVTELPVSDDPILLDAITKVSEPEADEEEREAAITVLAGYITQNSVEALAKVAKTDESSRLRVGALNALGSFNHESVFEPILLACGENSRDVKAAAARILSRLTIDRTQAISLIIRTADDSRLKAAAAACIDAGLANHIFDRLMHQDRKQAKDAFAMLNLLVSAGEYKQIVNSISYPSDIHVRLATIEALRTLSPVKMLPALYELTAKDNLAGEVREELEKLVAELTELTIS
jgi:hypothetical protein